MQLALPVGSRVLGLAKTGGASRGWHEVADALATYFVVACPSGAHAGPFLTRKEGEAYLS